MADNDSDKEMAASKQGAYGDSNSNSAEDDWLDTRYLPTPPNIPPARPARGCPHTSRSNERNDRNNRNDRNDSNDLPTASGVVSLPPGSRGPRSLYLRRDGDNFGFTLRHFIVYPPDSVAASDGRHAAVGALRTPMETIFVKQVYEDSPAHKAGLNHGDRIISVNGHSLNGKKYSQVVQLIQSSPSYLHLLVVPKEDDVLQKFFPETAHNPETNQRPQRFASPEHFSPRRNQHQLNEHLNYRPIVYPSTSHQNRPSADVVSCWSHEEPIYSEYRNAHYQQIRAPNSTGNIQNIQYRDNSSRSSDQVYSLPRDQIVYRASPNTRPQYGRNSLRDSDSIETTHIYSEPYVHDLSQRPRAQPQVPLYRKMGRRASDGNNISDNNSRTYDECRDCTSIGSSVDMVVNSSKMKSASKVTYHQLNPAHMAAADAQSQTSYSSPESVVPCGLQGLSYVNSAGCRLSLDAGRRESTASLNSSVANGSKDSLSSYESGSTVTGDTDDSIIMSRFRKSFEKKEEFLRRPSQPFTWKIPEETPPSANVKTIPSVIQREFYGRPQKLQKEWPPMEPLNNDQESPSKTPKPTNQNLQRVRIDIDTERDCSGAGATSNTTADGEKESPRNHMQAARNKFYEGATTGIEQTTQFVVGGMVSQRNTNVRQSKDKSLFVTTLSRIHESGPSTSDNYDDGMNGASLPYDLLDERRYPVPPNLQIVSRRTRQFESGRPLPEEEDGSLSDRTNLYRSELARLSSKCVVPNVQVRKREFETLEIENNKDYRRDRDTARRSTQRESRSLDNSGSCSSAESRITVISGNRMIPIGSKYLHCIAPTDYNASDISSFDNEGAQVRVRSNSAESWSAIPGSSKDWPAQPVVTDEKYRANKIGRQDSYVSALQSKVPDQDHNTQSVFVEQEEMDIGPQTSPPGTIVPNLLNHHYPKPIYNQNRMPVVSITPSNNTQKPVIIRPNQLTIASPMRPATAATTNLVAINTNNALHNTFGDVSATMLSASPVPGDEPPQVMRRTKNNTNTVGDEERATRRVSYLKATWGDRMHVESDLDLSDNEVQPQILRKYRRWKPPKFPKDIKPIRLLFEDGHAGRSGSAEGSGPLSLDRSDTPTSSDREAAPIIRDGALSCKFMELEGKRAHDRSWHKVWAVLKGPHLILYKDRHHHHPSPMGLVDTEQQLPGGVDMRYSIVNVADDYTKRKNVLRISAASPYRTELLLQADSPYEMADWVRTLQEQSGASIDEDKQEYMSENKQAQPQQVPAATSIQVQGVARLSPQPSNKSKLTTFRNRSPTGQSPKSKTWRGRVVKQFKKLNQGSGSPSSPTTPEKLTFGVPLELCQRALHTEFVPRFVEMCTEIIEERGLEVTGIYRVPGNNAAVSALTDELNKGINLAFQDVRSSDTNVVSSLLKSFFRKLPDSLLTSELYGHFIEADKIDDARTRLYEIKKLLNELPDFQYATLKYLILHLKKVVDKSSVNKMEARNLAIVFGPTLVRNVEDNMVTMVTDMSHQCRIVESLLLYPDWFFSEEDTELLILHQNTVQEVASQEIDNASASVNNTLLLGNISKIEGIKTESSTREKKDIMSSIISAANRKIQRKSRKTTTDNNSSSSSSHSQAHTKEETVTPASEPKETNIVPHLPEPEHEQKQISLESEESSNSDNIIPDDPLLMTYPQLEAKTSERIEKFKQETMAMLHQQKRRSDPSRSFMKPYHQNGHQATESTENPTSSDLLATITSEFDNKIKAFLQSPTNNSLTIADNIPYADESPDVTLNSFDLPIVEGAKMFSKCKESQNCDQDADKMSPKSFRNPSLHKNFNTSLNISSNNSLSNNLNKSQQQQQNAELLKNFMCKNSSYEADKEKDIDENENNPEEAKTDNDQQSNGDEVNDLCKVNYTNFLMNKELKCSSSDSKLKRSESLNKSNNYDSEQEHGKLKRSVSLNRAADRLKRSDSLTKYEKTESNINLRREMADDRRLKKVSTKLKRKNGMPERSIKRRHTVGGTKDFDRVHWLDNRLRYEAEETATNEEKENKAMRSSSPDLSSSERIRDNNDESKILPLESHI